MEMSMSDEVRGLTELEAQIDGARGQLERAETQLTAAATTGRNVTEAVRSALDDIVAVGKRIARLQQTVTDQIMALTPPLRCARCRSEMPKTARRCNHCATPLAQA
jgi:hypothetical protein